jgi:uncharacterized protein YdeI (YjbR/CyaY-like superfamily)
MAAENQILACPNAAEWESWLSHHHPENEGVWLLIAKKGSDKASITISEALDTALCYGWIDSQRKAYNASTYLQRYSPRGKRSPWSKLNVERAEKLIAAGRMRSPGFAEIAAAKADGRWAAAYASQRNADVPRDVVAALKAKPRASTAFEQLTKTARYALLLPVLKATTPKIRAARLKKAVAALDEGKSASTRSAPKKQIQR